MRLFKFAITVIVLVSLMEYVINHLGIIGAALIVGSFWMYMKHKY